MKGTGNPVISFKMTRRLRLVQLRWGAALPLMDLPSPGMGAVGPDGSAPTLTFPIAASSLSSSSPNVNS